MPRSSTNCRNGGMEIVEKIDPNPFLTR